MFYILERFGCVTVNLGSIAGWLIGGCLHELPTTEHALLGFEFKAPCLVYLAHKQTCNCSVLHPPLPPPPSWCCWLSSGLLMQFNLLYGLSEHTLVFSW